jgi:DNA-binding GntR family transcriptional regulator
MSLARGSNQGVDTLATAITASMRASIMCGELAPDTKLRLDELRKRFKVSYSPLREALSRLGAQGLVCILDQRGYRVAPVSPGALRQIVHLRLELEGLALREAIKQGGPSWAAGLLDSYQLLAELNANASANDTERWEHHHRRFHLALLQACDMPLLLQFISILLDQSDRYRRLFLKARSHDRDVPAEHAAILEASLAREADLAVALLQQHIKRTGENVLAAIDTGGEK